MIEGNSESYSIVFLVIRALDRARIPILIVALTYFIAVAVGIVMVHTGNEFAITYRDHIVASAQASPIIIALDQNDRLRATILDFRGNLLGSLADTVAGLGVIVSFPIIAYRGWIGGIVSINRTHASRLADPPEAVYYLSVLVLQLIPYTLAGGAGVNMGLAYIRPKSHYQGEKWLSIPQEAIRDVLRIYLLVVPLFMLASGWEFFMR